MMSTPPDFFTSDNNDPRREQQTEQNPSAAADDGQRRLPQPGDTGPQHRAAPTAPREHWQAPQPPRWQTAPNQSGPIPAQRPSQPGPQPGSAGKGAPADQQPEAAPHNNSGQHHQPPQPGYTRPSAAPTAQPTPPDTTASAAPKQPRRDDDFGERTSVISREHIAQARELSGFFDPADTGAPQQSQPTDPHPMFSGPMGGEPFLPTGYSGGGREPDQVVPSTRRIDVTGWRKAVQVMTFGLIKPGPSAKQLAAEELMRRIKASMGDVFVVAFVNSKGGVGKTTMAVAAGNAIARERGDRVIVVDVDTDLGNLSARFHENGGEKANIESFASMKNPGAYANIRVYTVQNDDRLEMLSSQNDPRSHYRLNSNDFESTMKILRSHYNVVLLDCGTAITSPLFTTIAKQVDCLVVVASQDAPGLNGASRTQAWLASHGLGPLLPRTVVVLNRLNPQKPKVDIDDAEAQFREKGTEHVLTIPFDDHLSEGAAIEFTRMDDKTQKAVKELAGAIARFYPPRQQQPAEGMGVY
jgi:MinD-like ATPase involved in chromosome partitioning or flagellar assembly